jgi:hypothetical protein
MNVTSMQDLGGGRVVLRDMTEVDALVARLIAVKRARNQIVRTYDYLRDRPGPQATGYRGTHLVYEYRASKSAYLGMKVEVQIRAELQHSRATAVETMDLFGGSRLKYDEGDPAQKRFFLVSSSLMALSEGLTQSGGARQPGRDLRRELSALEGTLGVVAKLNGFTAYVESFGASGRQSTLVLELRRHTRQLFVNRFDTLGEAQFMLASIEDLEDDNIDAVLISMSKFDQLQSAYPNYFAQTSEFARFFRTQPLPYRQRHTYQWM